MTGQKKKVSLKNDREYRTKKRQPSEHQAAWISKDPLNGKPEALFIDALEVAEHIAWRIARVLDVAPERGITGHEFSEQMCDYNVEVSRLDGDLCYIIEEGDIVIPANLIAPEAGLDYLQDRLTDIDQIPPQASPRNKIANPKILGRSPTVDQPAFFYSPTSSEIQDRSRAIRVGAEQRLEEEYLNLSDGEEAISTITPWNNEPSDPRAYSKKYTRQEDGTFDKEENSGETVFKHARRKVAKLDDLVAIYQSGGCTMAGETIRLDAHTGPRRKKLTTDAMIGPRNPQLKMLEARLTPAEYQRVAHDAEMTEIRMPTIQSTTSRFLHVDVDDHQMSRAYDLSDPDEVRAAAEELRASLPRSLATAQMACMLSSSSGMHKVDGGSDRSTYRWFDPVTDLMNCRLFFQLDKEIDQEAHRNQLRAVIKGADASIYTPTQPRYGPPAFVGAADPLRSVRFSSLGDGVVDAVALLEELQVAEHQVTRSSSGSRSRGRSSNVEVGDQFAKALARASEMRDLEKASPHLSVVMPYLEAIGDRKAMLETSGSPQHFGHLTRVLNAYWRAVFDAAPLAKKVTRRDVADGDRPEVAALNHLLTIAFVDAAAADDRTTDRRKHVVHYLGGDDRINSSGRLAEMTESLTTDLARDHGTKVRNLRAAIMSGHATPSQVGEFRDICLTGDGPLLVDRETLDSMVMIDDEAGTIWMDPVDGVHDGLHVGIDGKPPAPLVMDPFPKSRQTTDLQAVGTLAEAVEAGGGAIFITGDLDRDAELQKIKEARKPRRLRPQPRTMIKRSNDPAPRPAEAEEKTAKKPEARARSHMKLRRHPSI